LRDLNAAHAVLRVPSPQPPFQVPCALDAMPLPAPEVPLLVHAALIFVEPPLEAVEAPVAQVPRLREEHRTIGVLPPPEIDSGATDHLIGSDELPAPPLRGGPVR